MKAHICTSITKHAFRGACVRESKVLVSVFLSVCLSVCLSVSVYVGKRTASKKACISKLSYKPAGDSWQKWTLVLFLPRGCTFVFH